MDRTHLDRHAKASGILGVEADIAKLNRRSSQVAGSSPSTSTSMSNGSSEESSWRPDDEVRPNATRPAGRATVVKRAVASAPEFIRSVDSSESSMASSGVVSQATRSVERAPVQSQYTPFNWSDDEDTGSLPLFRRAREEFDATSTVTASTPKMSLEGAVEQVVSPLESPPVLKTALSQPLLQLPRTAKVSLTVACEKTDLVSEPRDGHRSAFTFGLDTIPESSTSSWDSSGVSSCTEATRLASRSIILATSSRDFDENSVQVISETDTSEGFGISTVSMKDHEQNGSLAGARSTETYASGLLPGEIHLSPPPDIASPVFSASSHCLSHPSDESAGDETNLTSPFPDESRPQFSPASLNLSSTDLKSESDAVDMRSLDIANVESGVSDSPGSALTSARGLLSTPAANSWSRMSYFEPCSSNSCDMSAVDNSFSGGQASATSPVLDSAKAQPNLAWMAPSPPGPKSEGDGGNLSHLDMPNEEDKEPGMNGSSVGSKASSSGGSRFGIMESSTSSSNAIESTDAHDGGSRMISAAVSSPHPSDESTADDVLDDDSLSSRWSLPPPLAPKRSAHPSPVLSTTVSTETEPESGACGVSTMPALRSSLGAGSGSKATNEADATTTTSMQVESLGNERLDSSMEDKSTTEPQASCLQSSTEDKSTTEQPASCLESAEEEPTEIDVVPERFTPCSSADLVSASSEFGDPTKESIQETASTGAPFVADLPVGVLVRGDAGSGISGFRSCSPASNKQEASGLMTMGAALMPRQVESDICDYPSPVLGQESEVATILHSIDEPTLDTDAAPVNASQRHEDCQDTVTKTGETLVSSVTVAPTDGDDTAMYDGKRKPDLASTEEPAPCFFGDLTPVSADLEEAVETCDGLLLDVPANDEEEVPSRAPISVLRLMGIVQMAATFGLARAKSYFVDPQANIDPNVTENDPPDPASDSASHTSAELLPNAIVSFEDRHTLDSNDIGASGTSASDHEGNRVSTPTCSVPQDDRSNDEFFSAPLHTTGGEEVAEKSPKLEEPLCFDAVAHKDTPPAFQNETPLLTNTGSSPVQAIPFVLPAAATPEAWTSTIEGLLDTEGSVSVYKACAIVVSTPSKPETSESSVLDLGSTTADPNTPSPPDTAAFRRLDPARDSYDPATLRASLGTLSPNYPFRRVGSAGQVLSSCVTTHESDKSKAASHTQI